MAQRLNNNRYLLRTLLLLGGALVVFTLLVTKHYEITPAVIRAGVANAQNAAVISGARLGVIEPCQNEDELIVFSPTVYICDEPVDELVYGEIYNMYPVSADGREIIYSFLDEGDKSRADEMIENIYNIQRYEAVTIDDLTWREDPFGERYWRFIFYSLRPLRHLLATADETGSERYYQKTREILDSFIEEGMDEEHAWDDSHGVSFRTMVLVNAWWKLREAGELPSALSDKILAALEVHGDHLMDPENYEADYNHAITQAAALLLLSESFPDLANAEAWRATAVRRIDIGLSSIIDPNGVLVENSPFYHFYVLEKYWEIYAFARENSISISSDFEETMTNMVTFGTYVLRPDQSVPLLGASSPRSFLKSGIYEEIANEHRQFDYVLTSGSSGSKPEETSILFPSSGIALMRSGWGERVAYEDETHLLFDTGPYRTDHSDLDALTFSLFSYGAPIIRDAGLYTYEEEHRFFNYFHGTRGHNTVMVDNTDQVQGSAEQHQLLTEDGYTQLAAWHELYPGVLHSRTIALLGHDAVLIVDALSSDQEHTYEQLFHLPPSAELEDDQATNRQTSGRIEKEDGTILPFHLTQLIPPQNVTAWRGQEEPIRGFCAGAYEVMEPCLELSYENRSMNTRYVTLIEYGDDTPTYTTSYDADTEVVRLSRGAETYEIDIIFPEEGVIDVPYIELDIVSADTDRSLLERARQFLNELL